MDGILLVDKPKGWTSFDVVAKVRGTLRKQQTADNKSFQAQIQEKLGVSHLDAVQESQEERAKRRNATESERQTPADTAMRQNPASVAGSAGQQGKAMRKIRVGHTGTLDPMATGLLVLLIGSYTKKASEYSKLDKVYEAELMLGQTSTTGDEEGQKTKISDKQLAKEEIAKNLQNFRGEISQTPPAYSAIKINGQRAYKLARAGKEIKIEPRKIQVYSLQLTEYSYPKLKVTVHVSSGTYIRTLAEDIGKKLGTGAYLSALRRTKVGKFEISKTIKVESLDVEKIKAVLFTA